MSVLIETAAGSFVNLDHIEVIRIGEDCAGSSIVQAVVGDGADYALCEGSNLQSAEDVLARLVDAIRSGPAAVIRQSEFAPS